MDRARESTPCSSKSVDVKNAEKIIEEEWLKQDYREITGAVSIDMDDSGNKDVMRDDHPRKGKSRVQRDRVIRKKKVYAKSRDPQAKNPLSKSRSEVAHKEVVQTEKKRTNLSMGRQKHYHDQKSKWKKSRHDEEVKVYFPRRKHDASKLNSFWQGPYLVKTLSGWTYLVKCGKRGLHETRVDRMGKECN
jgi:hypothetical protein